MVELKENFSTDLLCKNWILVPSYRLTLMFLPPPPPPLPRQVYPNLHKSHIQLKRPFKPCLRRLPWSSNTEHASFVMISISIPSEILSRHFKHLPVPSFNSGAIKVQNLTNVRLSPISTEVGKWKKPRTNFLQHYVDSEFPWEISFCNHVL